MHSAGSRNSSGKNFGALADQLFQSRGIFVINIINFVRAEETNFLLFPHGAERTLGIFSRFIIHYCVKPRLKYRLSFL